MEWGLEGRVHSGKGFFRVPVLVCVLMGEIGEGVIDESRGWGWGR